MLSMVATYFILENNMKVGDLVSISCKSFTGFAYIKGFGGIGKSWVLVAFIGDKGYTNNTQGYYPREQVTLLKGE